MIHRLPRLWPHLVALTLYLAAALWMTYPAVTQFSTHYIGHPNGDIGEYANLIHWMTRALTTGRSPFFHEGIVFPLGAGASLLWSIPLQSFPTWLLALVLPLPAAFNLSVLLFVVLNGWSMFVLARYLTRHRADGSGHLAGGSAAALVAGLIYATYPTFQGQIGASHIGLIAAFGAPLFAYAVLKAGECDAADSWQSVLIPHPRWLLVAGACFAISLWGNLVLLIYLTLPVGLWLGAKALLERDGRALVRLVAALMLGGLCTLPFIVPFALDRGGVPLGDVGGEVSYSAPLVSLVTPSFQNPLYSRLDWPHRVLGEDPFELTGYIGLITAGLVAAAVGALLFRRRRGPGSGHAMTVSMCALLIVMALCWVASLGPLLRPETTITLFSSEGYRTPITLPYALIQPLPIFNLTRTPARFNIGLGFMAALLAGYGLALLLNRPLRLGLRVALVLVLCGLIALDTRLFWPMPLLDSRLPDVFSHLDQRVTAAAPAVFNVPWAFPLTDNRAMMLQTVHGLPMIGGHIARKTPLDPAPADVLQETLDPALLRAAGIGIVIVHRQYGGADLDARARDRLGEPFHEDAEFGLYQVPATGSLPRLAHTPPLWTPYSEMQAISLYAGETETVALDLALTGERGARLSLDYTPLQTLDVGEATLTLALAPGYHRLEIAPQTACSQVEAPVTCIPFTVELRAVTALPASPALSSNTEQP